MNEEDRIKFVETRDGSEAAKKFAEQTLHSYEEAAIQQSRYWSSIEFLRSYLSK